MYSQLNYTIVRQHHAELIQAAGRRRLFGEIKTQRPRRQPTAVLNPIRGRITSAGALATPDADATSL
jgi:hypothetical protein